MFEGTLVESCGLPATGTARWTALGSMTLQCAVAALLMAIPLLRPEGLTMPGLAPRVEIPLPRPPLPVVVRQEAAPTAASPMSLPTQSLPRLEAVRGTLPSLHPVGIGPEPSVPSEIGMGWSGSPSTLSAIGLGSPGPSVVAAPRKPVGPVRVSTGVSAGLLLSPIVPVYPAIAKAAGVQGSVVIEAVISKAGRIESLHIVSGSPMLRTAAMDAVQAARYAPYRLNGEATEVQTTITVNFRLGS